MDSQRRGSGLSSWLQLHIGGGGAIKMGLLMVVVGVDGTDIADVSWRTHIILVMGAGYMGYMAH